MEEFILVETQGPIVRLTISRPKAMNALNRGVLVELGAKLDALASNTRVVILTGAGEKAFVAGADIQEMSVLDAQEAAAFSSLGHRVLSRLATMPQVVIAEVNGFALGGGCELVLAADFAIAVEGAKLGQPEVKLGLIPGFGGTTRLVRRVGLSRALFMITTGEMIDAEEARRIGLVAEVVKRGDLRLRVDSLASAIVQNGPLAVARAKAAVHVAAEIDLGAANEYEQLAFSHCFIDTEHKEGMQAFLEKRAPNWRSR